MAWKWRLSVKEGKMQQIWHSKRRQHKKKRRKKARKEKEKEKGGDLPSRQRQEENKSEIWKMKTRGTLSEKLLKEEGGSFSLPREEVSLSPDVVI